MGFGFGEQFQPRRLTHEEVRNALVGLNARTGLLYLDHIEWMIPFIIEGDQAGVGAKAVASRLKKFDEDIGNDTKKRLGLRGNVILSQSLYLTLTRRAYDDLDRALAAIVLVALQVRDRARDLAASAALGRDVRLSAVMDRHTCEAAKAIHGAIFTIAKAPSIPLPECDRVHCRCLFTSYFESLHGPKS